MIRFSSAQIHNLPEALHTEWLESNGLGGYASSTILLAHTRSYHGLLVAPLQDPPGRHVLLSRVEEVAHYAGESFLLSTNLYDGGLVHPSGFQYLDSFSRNLFPTFTYRLGGLELGREIFLVHGQNTVVLVYTVKNLPPGQSFSLEIRPLLAFRHFHEVCHRQERGFQLQTDIKEAPGLVQVEPYPWMPSLAMYHNATRVERTGHWYDNFHYPREAERGLNSQEDLFTPCVLHYRLERPGELWLVGTIEDFSENPEPIRLRKREVERRSEILGSATRPSFQRQLALSGEQFLIRKNLRPAILAAYPWHGERCRDALIAMSGLTQGLGRPHQFRALLGSYLDLLQDGLLPNYFDEDSQEPVFNAMDTSLWLFEALWQYLRLTNDWAFVDKKVFEKLVRVVDHFIKGTRHQIRMDPQDFLLSGKAPGMQLTWMDAKDGDLVITPRAGKPVEVQALWYNALRILERLAQSKEDLNQDASSYAHLAASARKSFNLLFWQEARGFLADYLFPDGTPDWSLRPNQILSVSLSFPVLDRSYQSRVLSQVREKLWTPFGLRTLSPEDPRYQGYYEGSESERRRATHQGTVWSWLLGPFYNAFFRVRGSSEKTIQQASKELEPMQNHLEQFGLGSISTLFDGYAPHHPRGSISRASSVGEFQRIYYQYLKPQKESENTGP